jgi:hypothetical protein
MPTQINNNVVRDIGLKQLGINQTYVDPNTSSDLAAGTDELQAALWSGVDALSASVGAEDISKYAQKQAKNNVLQSLENPAKYQSTADLKSAGDVLGYIGEQIQREIPSLAVDVGVATAGALASPAGSAGGVVAFNAAKRAALGSMFVQSVGDARMQSLNEGVDNPYADMGVGLINTALEFVPVKMSLDAAVQAYKAGQKVDFSKALLGTVGKIGAVGAGTEVAQQLNNYLSIAAQKDGYDVFSDDNIDQLIMSAIAGGGVSAAMGGAAELGGAYAGLSQVDPTVMPGDGPGAYGAGGPNGPNGPTADTPGVPSINRTITGEWMPPEQQLGQNRAALENKSFIDGQLDVPLLQQFAAEGQLMPKEQQLSQQRAALENKSFIDGEVQNPQLSRPVMEGELAAQQAQLEEKRKALVDKSFIDGEAVDAKALNSMQEELNLIQQAQQQLLQAPDFQLEPMQPIPQSRPTATAAPQQQVSPDQMQLDLQPQQDPIPQQAFVPGPTVSNGAELPKQETTSPVLDTTSFASIADSISSANTTDTKQLATEVVTHANDVIQKATTEGRQLTAEENRYVRMAAAVMQSPDEQTAATVLGKYAASFEEKPNTPTQSTSSSALEVQVSQQDVPVNNDYNPYESSTRYVGQRGKTVDLNNIDDSLLYKLVTVQRKVEEINANNENIRATAEEVKPGLYVIKQEPLNDTGAAELKKDWRGAFIRAKQSARKFSSPTKNNAMRVFDKNGVPHKMSMHTLIQTALNNQSVDSLKQHDKTSVAVKEALHEVVAQLIDHGYTFPRNDGTLYGRLLSALMASSRSLKGDAKELALDTVLYSNGGTQFKLRDLAPVKKGNGSTVKGARNAFGDVDPSYKSYLNPSSAAKEAEIQANMGKINSIDSQLLDPSISAAEKESLRIERQKLLASNDFLAQYTKENDFGSTDRPEANAGVIDGAVSDIVKDEVLARKNEASSKLNMDGTAKDPQAKPRKKWRDTRDIIYTKDTRRQTAKGSTYGVFSADVEFSGFVESMHKMLGLKQKYSMFDPNSVDRAIADSNLSDKLKAKILADAETAKTNPNFARVYYDGDKFYIMVSDQMHKDTSYFAVAHELGHAFLESARDGIAPAAMERLQGQYKHHLNKAGVTDKKYPFKEWFADQVALYAIGYAPTKKGIVHRQMTDIANRVKSVIKNLVDKVIVENIDSDGALTDQGIFKLSRFTPDAYFAKTLDAMLEGRRTDGTLDMLNSEFDQHLQFDSLTWNFQNGILNGSIKRPSWLSFSVFKQKLHGFYGKARSFVMDTNARKDAMDKAIAAINKFTAGNHTLLAKGFADTDARLRQMGEPGSVARRAAEKIADMLYTPYGRKTKPGFTNAVFQEMGMWLHHYAKAFDSDGLSKEDLDKVNEYLVSESDINFIPAKYRKTVQAFRDVHQKFFEQVVSHIDGVDKTPRANHFPRVWDHVKVAANRDKLIDIIERAAQAKGITVDAAASVDYIIALGQRGNMEDVDAEPTKSHAAERTLWFVDNAEVQDLLVRDANEVLNSYVQQMLKKYEWQNRTGGYVKSGSGMKFKPRAKLDALLSKLSEKDRAYAEQAIKAHLGQLRNDMDPEVKGAMALLMSLFNAAYLPLSTLSSLIETAVVGIRMKDTPLRDVVNILKDTNIKDALARAQEWGFSEERLVQQVVNSVYGSPTSGTFSGRLADKINSTLFKYNGQQFLTSFNRALAAALGEEFLVTHALGAQAGDAKSREYLAELIGEKHVDFAIDKILEWNKTGRPTPKPDDVFRTRSKTETVSPSVLVQHMLGRFVDEAVLRPNAGQKPLWASDPLYALIAHLKSYFWAAQKTILPQLLESLTKTSLKNPSAALPLFYFGVLGMLLTAIGLETRDELKQFIGGKRDMTEDMSPAEYAMELMFRANVLFSLEPYRASAEVAGWSDSPMFGAASAFIPTLSYINSAAASDIGALMPVYGIFD